VWHLIFYKKIDWVKESTHVVKSEQVGGGGGGEARTIKIASGKQLSISDRRYRVYRPHNSALSVLIIRRTRKQDAGIYRCNLAGSTTRHKYMILNVTGGLCSKGLQSSWWRHVCTVNNFVLVNPMMVAHNPMMVAHISVLGMSLNCIRQSYICCHHYVGH